MPRFLRLFLSALILIFAAATPGRAADEQPMRLPVDRAPLVFEARHGPRPLRVEIADTEIERERGLMFRKDFPEDRAMLFVFPDAQEVTMWMENTPLPLDMVFIGAAGRITSIRGHAKPYSIDIIGSGGPARFVVELDAGVAARLGLEKGDRVRHPVIDRIAGKR
jgi:uncharacterized protein